MKTQKAMTFTPASFTVVKTCIVLDSFYHSQSSQYFYFGTCRY